MSVAQRLTIGALLVLLGHGISGGAQYQWVNESQDFPSTIGGLAVSEYKDAGWGGIDWFISGQGTNGGNETEHLYLLDPPNTAWTTFSIKSTSVAFVMYGDNNDGDAAFFVDGDLICTRDMFNLGGRSLLVTLLPYDFHTIAVGQLGTRNPLSLDDDVAIAGGAALVPEPTSLFMLAMCGLGLARRRVGGAGRSRRHITLAVTVDET